MGKASSAKKIKRVQQAGVSRAPGQRRNMGYPALVGGIILVGLVLVFFARGERAAQASEAPIANQDHWHAAFGINVCGEFEANAADFGPDTTGIHTHQDGLIHIHPWLAASSGKNATFGVFADQIGLEIGTDSFTLPDGTTYTDGDDCTDADGKKEAGRMAMYVWPPQATDATEPKVVTEGIRDIRFTDDGQAFVLAFLPEDEEPPLPPSLPELAAPSDLEQPSQEGSTDFTTTSAPGATETTIAEGAESTTSTTEADATTTTAGG